MANVLDSHLRLLVCCFAPLNFEGCCFFNIQKRLKLEDDKLHVSLDCDTC